MEYSPFARTLHWATAALVASLVPIGLTMTRLDSGPLQDRLFTLHESFGVLALGAGALRIGLRLRGALPPFRAHEPVACAAHVALYAMLVLTPALGWAALSAYGLGPDVFGVTRLPALLDKDEALSKSLFLVHEAAAFTLVALVAAHVAGALRHGFGPEGVIWRMLPARGSRGDDV